jgi:hypothetical protein
MRSCLAALPSGMIMLSVFLKNCTLEPPTGLSVSGEPFEAMAVREFLSRYDVIRHDVAHG